MNKISIAGFTDEAAVADFIRRISDATVESLLYLSSSRQNPPAVAIVQVRAIGKSNRQFYSKYHQYSSLFYLNEAAVAMCEDLNLGLNLVGEAETMSEEPSFDLEAYYVALAERAQAKEEAPEQPPLTDETRS